MHYQELVIYQLMIHAGDELYLPAPSDKSITAQSYSLMKSGLKVTSLSLTTNSRNEPIADSSIELMTCRESVNVPEGQLLQASTHILIHSTFLKPVSEIKDIEEESKDRLDH